MCNCNEKDTLEHYGPVRYFPGEYPIPQDERGIHKCNTGMYPQDAFDADFHMPVTPNCPNDAPLAISNASDPNKRYQTYGGVTGTGCMNLDCVCPNCIGDCKCGRGGKGMRRLMSMDPLHVALCIAVLIALYIMYKRRQA